MILSIILRKENNNLDIFRVIAAFMVIYGHAYALAPIEGQSDIVGRLLIFDYSGSLAVKIFFFLSGLVVTNSLIDKKDFNQFIISRVFRLWPALIVVLGSWAFFLGPILSSKSIQEYFLDSAPYRYFFQGVIMNIQYDLPGVFQNNAFKSVNGSLWSIPFEVYAYIFLATVFLFRVNQSKYISVFIFSLILIDPITHNKFLFTWLPQNPEVTLLAPCFALGALFALFKHDIKICSAGLVGVWSLFYLFKLSAYNFYFFYLAIFYSIVFISNCSWALKLKPTFDISYGVYLWGWPIQQIMAQQFPNYGIRFNQISSILISALLGCISWYLIERRFIKIGSNIGRRVSSKTTSFLEKQMLN